MPKNHYLVSAIVSVYNCERFIAGCLEDLERQTIADKVEVVVVNTGSQQNEDTIVKDFQSRFSNIVYIKVPERESLYQAWNRGIKAASGKYITNANSDDRHRKDALEIMASELEKNADIDLVYADDIITEVENETFEHHTPARYCNRPEFDRFQLLLGCFIGPQPMWRKTIHKQFGYFDETLKVVADYEFWVRVSEKRNFKHIKEYLGLYYVYPGSALHRNFEQTSLEIESVRNKYIYRVLHNKSLVKKVKIRQSGRVSDLGHFYLERTQRFLAAKAFLRSLRYSLRNLQSYKGLLICCLPLKVVEVLRKAKIFITNLSPIRYIFKRRTVIEKVVIRRMNKPKNILFISGAARVGGGQKVLLDIIDNITKAKYLPIVILPERGSLENELVQWGVKYGIIKDALKYSKIWPFPAIYQIIEYVFWIIKENISLIHVNDLKNYRIVSIAARLTRKKLLCHLHFPPSVDDLRYTLKIYPECLLCCCDDIKGAVLKTKLYPGRTVTALLNAINVGKYRPIPIEEAEERRVKLGFSGASHIVTTIGDLSARKGQTYFMQMAKQLLANFPDAIFLIIGKEKKSDKGYEKKLKDYAHSLGIAKNINFLGFVNNVNEYLMATDIMVLPSLKEGLPLVILEAMACAKPVVATNVNGIPEAIIDGETGFLVEPQNVDALTQAVSNLLWDESLRIRLGQNARKRVEEFFNIKTYAEKLENIYSQLLNNRMKTLLFTVQYPPFSSGVPNFYYHISKFFPANEIAIFTAAKEGSEKIDKTLPFSVYRSKLLENYRVKYNVHSFFIHMCISLKLLRIIAKEKVNKLLLGNSAIAFLLMGYLIKKAFRKNYIIFLHGDADSSETRLKSDRLRRYFYNHAHGFIVNSNFTKERLQKKFDIPSEKVSVLYPGTDIKMFYPFDGVETKRVMNLEGEKVLLTVGRLDERKGQDMVIKAMAKVVQQIPNIVYVVIGKGKYREELCSLVESLNLQSKIIFLGYVPNEDLPKYYNMCDVFIMANRVLENGDAEGFGMVFLEANACGKPVIGGRDGGSIEAIKDGETGLLVDGHNIDDIFQKVVYLLSNENIAKKLGEAGRQRVLNEFVWDMNVRNNVNRLKDKFLN